MQHFNVGGSPVHPGNTVIVFPLALRSPDTYEADFATQGAGLIVSLYVPAITGTLDVTVYSIQDGAETLILTIPTISSPNTSPIAFTTSNLFLSTLRVRAVVAGGQANFSLRVRATPQEVCNDGVRSVNGDYGPDVLLDSDDVPEGSLNKYFTQANFDAAFAAKDTDDLAEGSTNLYFTAARSRLALSATSPVLYDNTTGVISLGTVGFANGGTGQTTRQAAIDALTATGTPTYVWTWNGTNGVWTAPTGGLTSLTSTDGSIDITSPSGPTPNLSLHFPISAPGGSVSAPSYRFDSDTGMYSPSDGLLNFATNGVLALAIDNNQEAVFANTVTADDFIYPAKTANTFLSGPASGGPAIPTFRAIAQGDIAASALPFPMNAPGGSVGAPSYNFDSDSGMWSPSDGIVAFATNGVNRVQIENNGTVNMFGDLTITGNISAANFPSPITGTPNVLAFFDSTGNLMSDNYWAAQDDGRLSGSFNYTGDGQSLFSLGSNVTAADTWNGINLIQGSLSNNGTLTGFVSLLNLNYNDGAVSTEFVNGINIGTQISTTGDKQLANFYSNGTVGGNLSGLLINSDDDTTGGATLFNIFTQGDTGGELSWIRAGNQPGNLMNALTGIDVLNQGDVANFATLVRLNNNGTITKGLDIISSNINATVGDGTGISLNGVNIGLQNTAFVDGNINGFILGNNANWNATNGNLVGFNLNNSGSGNRMTGVTIFNNGDQVEEIRGFQFNSNADARTSTGLDIYMEGTITDDAQAIRVSVQNVTSTTQRVRSMDINGGTWSYNNNYRPGSGLFVDSGNNNFTEMRVANGSPVTGTDAFINNSIVAVLAEDDVAIGPIGLGFVHSSAISLLGIATGKTMDLHRGLLVVASVQNPGYADAGAVTEYQGIVYAGALPGGGNTTIGTATGLLMPTGFDSYAGTNFGVRVQGVTADNYLNKLAVGTASNTAAAGLLLDVNGQVGITAIGSGLSVAEGLNAKMGLATLVGGTVTVNTTAVTANSRVFHAAQIAGGTMGVVSVQNVIPGTSFDLISTDPGDTSTVAWMLVEAI